MADALPKTPLLDELEKGKWPSFVTEIKMAAKKSPMCKDLLGQLEQSYEEKLGHWKHGGIVGVMGYGGGVIGRYTDLPEKYPNISHFHTMRINQPAGWFYTTDALRKICDIWERHGSGLTNMHGSTGDIVLLGTKTDELEPIFDELTRRSISTSVVPAPTCGHRAAAAARHAASGPVTTRWRSVTISPRPSRTSCTDRPSRTSSSSSSRVARTTAWLRSPGPTCPSSAPGATTSRSTRMQSEYAEDGMDIQADVVDNCPAKCMEWDGKKLNIENCYCRHCMHCINVMPKALRPGKDRGATVLLGSKAPIVEGALLSSVLIPFMKMEPPYEELKEMVERIWDVWCEEGKNRERIGEFIQRVGMGNFLEAIEVEPVPEMVAHPRENPYVFYEEYFEEDEDDEEEEES